MKQTEPQTGGSVRGWGGLVDAAEGRLPYPVWTGTGALGAASAIAIAAADTHRYVVIADAAVRASYAERIAAKLPGGRTTLLEVPSGEASKTRETWARLTDEMLAAGCGRDTAVVAVGGGVVGDLAGFVAATYMRGIPVVQVPTTLLSMVDASVGGKTAVDTPAGKNLVGAFHPPAAVVIDPMVLRTLPHADLMAGFAEVVKHGVIADTSYLRRVTELLSSLPKDGLHSSEDGRTWDAVESVVAGSVAIKARVVAADEREGGMRKILNFGHTIGHAVESLSGFALRHGECVAIGMVAEAEAGELAGVTEAGTAVAVREAVRLAGLPERIPGGMSAESILAATRGDKKARAGAVEYALPERLGAMAGAGGRWSVPLADAAVLDALARCA